MHVANRPTVMVADNFEDTRFLLKYWLEIEGCRVVEAGNGEEAVELIRGECPDLILMSLRMPVRDGLDATRCIRQHIRECDVPIVAMSAYPTAGERASAFAAGCDWFVAQPIDFDDLSILLSRFLAESAHS